MKLRFKVQSYQTEAVDSVVDCFAGQIRNDSIRYRIDPGTAAPSLQIKGLGLRGRRPGRDGSGGMRRPAGQKRNEMSISLLLYPNGAPGRQTA